MSGGDPLLLSDRRIAELCGRLRAIPHLEVIRIGSRVPCHLPERITPELCGILKQYHPLYINTHFNHPDELTPATAAGVSRSEEHTSELQSLAYLVCRLLLEKKKNKAHKHNISRTEK